MNTLKKLRLKKGLTQIELAEKAGITVRCYQQYENGERQPRAGTAIQLAKLLHSSVEKLWGDNPTTGYNLIVAHKGSN